MTIQLKVDCGNHDKHSSAAIPSHFAPDDFLHDPVPSSGEPGAQPTRPQTGVPELPVLKQIQNLRKRIFLIRNMQAAGVSSLLLCVICMFLLFGGQLQVAQACFAVSLILMIVSLLLSLWEIWISVDALNVHLCPEPLEHLCGSAMPS